VEVINVWPIIKLLHCRAQIVIVGLENGEAYEATRSAQWQMKCNNEEAPAEGMRWKIRIT
jgi:hypothetical protein